MNFLGTFEDFISGYGIWILVGCLGIAFVVSVIFLFLNVNRVKKERLQAKKEAIQKIKKEENKLEKEDKKVEIEKVKLTKKPVAKTTKTAIKSKSLTSKSTSTKEGIYLVSFDKKTKEWAVKKSSATRATKKFKSKEEAVKFAKKLSK